MTKIIQFLKQLSQNNHKEWFDENRKTYELCKTDFINTVDSIIKNCEKFDKELINLEAKKCIFRINKDVRFSKDKSPYKLNFGASINPGGKKSMIPGYYLHIEPGKSFLAGGCYQPMPDVLASIRQEIDYNTEEFKKILNHKDFKLYFKSLSNDDKLKTAPKGYDKNHPELELLQHKHFIAIHQLTDAQIKSADFDKRVTKVFKALLPLNQFLRKAVS